MLLRACVKIRRDAAGHRIGFQVRDTRRGSKAAMYAVFLLVQAKLNGSSFLKRRVLALFSADQRR